MEMKIQCYNAFHTKQMNRGWVVGKTWPQNLSSYVTEGVRRRASGVEPRNHLTIRKLEHWSTLNDVTKTVMVFACRLIYLVRVSHSVKHTAEYFNIYTIVSYLILIITLFYFRIVYSCVWILKFHSSFGMIVGIDVCFLVMVS